jgi:hypothetical protein
MRVFSSCLLLVMASSALAAQTAAGLRWTAPGSWRVEPAQSMRAATYSAAPVPGDTARAECAIYFFGQGQGGSIGDNIDRWKSQFSLTSGAAAPARVTTRVSRGLRFTLLDTACNDSGLGGPMGGGRVVPGYRLLGAIVEGPGGNVFIKFTGPERTIGANQLQFEQLLASIQPEK